jgi:hypothetical protein
MSKLYIKYGIYIIGVTQLCFAIQTCHSEIRLYAQKESLYEIVFAFATNYLDINN